MISGQGYGHKYQKAAKIYGNQTCIRHLNEKNFRVNVSANDCAIRLRRTNYQFSFVCGQLHMLNLVNKAYEV